jgi:hypothetical protein
MSITKEKKGWQCSSSNRALEFKAQCPPKKDLFSFPQNE